ncbi:MAG: hypothetical protein SGJ02_08930 [bacterium]|nr:hypothetical protein [bacterium]
MKAKEDKFFWPSFSDLMTSMFFIMLVLYVLTFIELKKKEDELQQQVESLDRKLRVYTLVEQNLKPLQEDSTLFRYESQYKRFSLAFDVKFVTEKVKISPTDLENYTSTVGKINEAGISLRRIIDKLAKEKQTDPQLKDVYYLLIISGYASNLLGDTEYAEYIRSYNRAWHLWNHWRNLGINFEDKHYDGLVDLQISGNGWGGVGRFQRDPQNHFLNEEKNQRFIIQIVPKIGNTTEE